MSKVRAELSLRRGAANGVAVDAREGHECLAPFGSVRGYHRRLLLLSDPSIKLVWCMHHDADQHSGVLCAAVLGAVTEIGAGDCGLNPHAVFFVGDYISLAGKLRHPEAVRDIRRLQVEKRGLAFVSSAGRHVQFIGGYDAEFRITNLPPPRSEEHTSELQSRPHLV